jgi:HK97 gp10 family phage protein
VINTTTQGRVGTFIQGLRELVSAVRGEVITAETDQANAIVEEMKSQVPPGNLQDSIRWEFDKRVPGSRILIKAGGPKTTVRIAHGATAQYDYARAQEFGTVKRPAEPFFWNTVRRRAKKSREAVVTRAKRVIERKRL